MYPITESTPTPPSLKRELPLQKHFFTRQEAPESFFAGPFLFLVMETHDNPEPPLAEMHLLTLLLYEILLHRVPLNCNLLISYNFFPPLQQNYLLNFIQNMHNLWSQVFYQLYFIVLNLKNKKMDVMHIKMKISSPSCSMTNFTFRAHWCEFYAAKKGK